METEIRWPLDERMLNLTQSKKFKLRVHRDTMFAYQIGKDQKV